MRDDKITLKLETNLEIIGITFRYSFICKSPSHGLENYAIMLIMKHNWTNCVIKNLFHTDQCMQYILALE